MLSFVPAGPAGHADTVVPYQQQQQQQRQGQDMIVHSRSPDDNIVALVVLVVSQQGTNITIDEGTVENATTNIIQAFANMIWDFDKGTGIVPALFDYVPVLGKYGNQTLQLVFILAFSMGTIIVLRKVK